MSSPVCCWSQGRKLTWAELGHACCGDGTVGSAQGSSKAWLDSNAALRTHTQFIKDPGDRGKTTRKQQAWCRRWAILGLLFIPVSWRKEEAGKRDCSRGKEMYMANSQVQWESLVRCWCAGQRTQRHWGPGGVTVGPVLLMCWLDNGSRSWNIENGM